MVHAISLFILCIRICYFCCQFFFFFCSCRCTHSNWKFIIWSRVKEIYCVAILCVCVCSAMAIKCGVEAQIIGQTTRKIRGWLTRRRGVRIYIYRYEKGNMRPRVGIIIRGQLTRCALRPSQAENALSIILCPSVGRCGSRTKPNALHCSAFMSDLSKSWCHFCIAYLLRSIYIRIYDSNFVDMLRKFSAEKYRCTRTECGRIIKWTNAMQSLQAIIKIPTPH